jgi:lysophospholipase L1-like esterase
MPERTFLRYQLQNSIRQIQASLPLFSALLEKEPQELAAHLRELEEIRHTGVQALRASHPEVIRKLHGKRVLFLGDSLTVDEIGYRPLVSEAASLVARNGAISGGTSASLLHLALRKLTSKTSPVPELISVMLGTNDSVSVEREELHQVSREEYLRNMREILTHAQKTGARVLVFAIPPVIEGRFNAHAALNLKMQSNNAIAAYNAALSALCASLSLTFIPHTQPLQESFYEQDGLHWSADGQRHFATVWLEAAADILP